MSTERTFIIVGASLAGAKAAETLRHEGFDGRIVLVGEESERPYQRPPLSKDYLRGQAGLEKVYVHDEGFYTDHEVELRTSARAVAIEPAAGLVLLEGGEQLRYDRLLLATGAAPRHLSIPGSDLPGVHSLRTLEDSDSLRKAIAQPSRVVVVGAGWIGSEVAASACQMGAEVVLIERGALPLERVLGAEVGSVYRDLHTDHGVEFLPGTGVEAFAGARSVEEVRTSDGRRIACDLVVVGVGAAPRVELAEAAGLVVENGIAVDGRLETSAPGVFAAGDVAAAWHPFYQARIRVEHWANALHQGPAAAGNMLGLDVPYERLPYFILRPVRPGHGVHRVCPELGQGRFPGRPHDAGVHRLLDAGRAGRGRHERQRLGRDRPHRRTDPPPPADRPDPAGGLGCGPRGPGR
jgi:3-phenylpropionate/trans-cinnamate dioxygenase ferredoxin reductase subunit